MMSILLTAPRTTCSLSFYPVYNVSLLFSPQWQPERLLVRWKKVMEEIIPSFRAVQFQVDKLLVWWKKKKKTSSEQEQNTKAEPGWAAETVGSSAQRPLSRALQRPHNYECSRAKWPRSTVFLGLQRRNNQIQGPRTNWYRDFFFSFHFLLSLDFFYSVCQWFRSLQQRFSE